MRILVTGASSFVGAHVARVAAGRHHVLALHFRREIGLCGLTPVRADLRSPRSRGVLAALRADAVVHVATRIRGDAVADNRAMMDGVLALGLPVVLASSTVVRWKRRTPYGDSRREDEERLRESGLPFAILRPSAPYGPRFLHHAPGHRESFHLLADLVRRSPVVPVLGDGQYRRQPIHVDDFGAAVVALLERGPLPGCAWDAGGAEAISFDEIVRTLAAAAGRRTGIAHLPVAWAARAARFTGDFDPDLLASVTEDETAPPGELTRATGVSPRSFREGAACLLR